MNASAHRTGPERIVCLTEETTELLYLLGEDWRIVGISAYTVRPAQARLEKPVVSAFIQGSIPRIKALKPDLVIGFSDIQADLARDLIREGLNVLITNQRSLMEIATTMDMIGRLVGQGEQVAALIAGWQQKLDQVRARVKMRSQPDGSRQVNQLRVFFQEWDEPLISGIRWVSELLEVAGAIDIFAELRSQGLAQDRIVTPAAVVERNPDLIIGSWCGKKVNQDWVRQNFAGTSAVQKGALFEMDPSVILQPGPALFEEGLDRLLEILEEVA